MFAFIDESGDPGGASKVGGSHLFAMAMVLFDDAADAMAAQNLVAEVRRDLGIRPELKFNRTKSEHKTVFFDAIRALRFRAYAVVIDKDARTHEGSLDRPDALYREALGALITQADHRLSDARIIVDGAGSRPFRRGLVAHVRASTAAGAVRNVRLKDSRSDDLLQMADMVVGAVARARKPWMHDARQWERMLTDGGQLRKVVELG